MQEIAEGLTKQPLPEIVTHPDHSKYQEQEAFHEAGYDSLLTATIMIRLAAKLGAEHEKQHPSEVAPLTKGAKNTNTNRDLQDFIRDGREKVQKPIVLPPIADLSVATGRQKRKQKKKAKSKEATERRAKTKNIFDNLRDLSLDPEADDAVSTESEPAIDFEDAETWKDEPAAEAGSWENDLFVQDKSGWVPIEQSERHAMEMIPKLDGDSAFWKEFGNTLRVFGTQEAVLKIADW